MELCYVDKKSVYRAHLKTCSFQRDEKHNVSYSKFIQQEVKAATVQ